MKALLGPVLVAVVYANKALAVPHDFAIERPPDRRIDSISSDLAGFAGISRAASLTDTTP